MYGMGGAYQYAECGACGTLRLINSPSLRQFYPDNYYSPPATGSSLRTGIERAKEALVETGTAIIMDRLFRVIGWKGGKDASILDVGCGTGTLLRGLRRLGYRRLRGVDPFLPSTIEQPVKIHNHSLSQVAESFDLITLHHSLEHIPECRQTLEAARDRLNPGGAVLVRIPIVNYAWKRFGTRWVQLDAPRHVVLFTERGFRSLAENAQLKVESVVYDSTPFQFWGSEVYERDGILRQNYPRGLARFLFFRMRMWLRYGRAVSRLNRIGQGDQSAFLLTRAR